MNSVQEALDRFDLLRSQGSFQNLLQSIRAMGEVEGAITAEIDIVTMERPNSNGVYGGGYINGLFFAKRKVTKEQDLLRDSLFNLLGFEKIIDELYIDFVLSMKDFERGNFELEETLDNIREIIAAYFKPTGVVSNG
mgnify:CR=1 FL=1